MATEVYELRITGRTGMENVQNVMHFVGGNLTVGATADNGKSLIDSWNTNVHAAWLDILPSNYFLDIYQARRALVKPSVVSYYQYQPNDATGTFGSTSALDQLCPVIRTIPVMGAIGPGKIFIPAVPGSAVQDNGYNGSWLSAITTFMNLITTDFGISGKTWQLVVVTKSIGTYHLVSGWNVSPRFGFQKRRRSPV